MGIFLRMQGGGGNEYSILGKSRTDPSNVNGGRYQDPESLRGEDRGGEIPGGDVESLCQKQQHRGGGIKIIDHITTAEGMGVFYT